MEYDKVIFIFLQFVNRIVNNSPCDPHTISIAVLVRGSQ